MPKIVDDRSADIGPNAPADSEQLARQQAIKQIKARRSVQDQHRCGRRRRDSPGAHLGRHGVPQRGRLADPRIQPEPGHQVWNIWIIYPFLAWALLGNPEPLGVRYVNLCFSRQLDRARHQELPRHC